MNKEFLDLYNELDSFVESKYGLINETSSIYYLIQNYRNSESQYERELAEKLDTIRQIRNLYVHETGLINELFTVSEEVVEALKEIILYEKNPARAKEVMHHEAIIFGTYDSEIIDLIDKIIENGVSNIPILDDKRIVLGVFNSDSLIYAISKGFKLSSESKIKEIIDQIKLESHLTLRFLFVSENQKIENLQKYFNESKEKYKKRLPIIFVTKNGKINEPLQGIISPIDLIKR